jgi:hypothetical protein
MAAAMPSRAKLRGRARPRQARTFAVKSQTSMREDAAEYRNHARPERQQLACEGEADDNVKQHRQGPHNSYDSAFAGAAVDAMQQKSDRNQ